MVVSKRNAAVLLAVIIAAVGLRPAEAAVDRCLAIASAPDIPYLQPVGARAGALKPSEVEITFIGHATFLIESARGVRVATDYNDYVRPPVIPEIATMNRAHSSHFTDAPPLGIKHVLRGWNPEGGPAKHDVEMKDVHVRNVATNIRDWGGGVGAYGNSIFIFEIAGLCIGHLGHLHHTLTPEQLAQVGQLDVVMVPVDAGYTMDLGGMIEVLKAMKPRLILPMHYFGTFTLNRFLERVRSEWPVDHSATNRIVVSHETLPADTKILILPGL